MPRERKLVSLWYVASSWPTNLFCKASSQLSTRFDRSIVTVIGPTPPGTGVTFEHRCKHSSFNSTSPTILEVDFYSESCSPFADGTSTKLMPTSMMIAPSLIHAPLIKPGTPHAAMTISASLIVSLNKCSGVFEKHTVTCALYLFSSRYMGMPTMLLLPMSATFLPSRASVLPKIS